VNTFNATMGRAVAGPVPIAPPALALVREPLTALRPRAAQRLNGSERDENSRLHHRLNAAITSSKIRRTPAESPSRDDLSDRGTPPISEKTDPAIAVFRPPYCA